MDKNNNDIQSINEFGYSLICEYFASVERQGPGSREATLHALSFIEHLPEHPHIADVGCGTGSSAVLLAKETNGKVIAVDLFPQFVEILNSNARRMGVGDRVDGMVGDMASLPFADEELDLLWCEGAIYNIGFERGLREWKRFLKPGGYIALTEVTWLTDERPEEIERFWNEAYPEMDTLSRKQKQMQQEGYTVVATFLLPDSCWTENYYIPQQKVQKQFLEKHKGNAAAEELVRNQRHEARLYDKYKDYYGYVFYIGKKA